MSAIQCLARLCFALLWLTPMVATCRLSLVVMPVVHGIILTFNNAFMPVQKVNALRWAAAKATSEIYSYRARSGKYSSVGTSDWRTKPQQDDHGGVKAKQESVTQPTKRSPAKSFVDSINEINEKAMGDSSLQSSSLKFYAEEDMAQLRKRLLHKQPGGHPDWHDYCQLSEHERTVPAVSECLQKPLPVRIQTVYICCILQGGASGIAHGRDSASS